MMRSAYCIQKDCLVDAKDYSGKYRGCRWQCPECRNEVRYRNWRNAPPYFAHVRFNLSCSLSSKGDGLFFMSRDKYGMPVDPVDYLNRLEGIDTQIVFDVGSILFKRDKPSEKAAGVSCWILADEFGFETARKELVSRYGDTYTELMPMTLTEIRETAFEVGKWILRNRKASDAWKCMYMASQLGSEEASDYLENSVRLRSEDRKRFQVERHNS